MQKIKTNKINYKKFITKDLINKYFKKNKGV